MWGGVHWKACQSTSTLGTEEGGGASIPNDSHLSKVGTARPQSSPSQNPPEGGGRGRGGEGRGAEGDGGVRHRTCDLSFEQAAFGFVTVRRRTRAEADGGFLAERRTGGGNHCPVFTFVVIV